MVQAEDGAVADGFDAGWRSEIIRANENDWEEDDEDRSDREVIRPGGMSAGHRFEWWLMADGSRHRCCPSGRF